MQLLIFPHQLYDEHPGLSQDPEQILLVEDTLFFGDAHHPASFHQQKLWLLRASMKRFAQRLEERGHEVVYLEYGSPSDSLTQVLREVVSQPARHDPRIQVADPVDFLLSKRLHRAAGKLGFELEVLATPGFLNRPQENAEYRQGKQRWFMADFYKWQRKRLEILVDGEEPQGGQWSFDAENRKKVPAKLRKSLPELPDVQRDAVDREAVEYVRDNFAGNPGSLERLIYPTSHEAARRWLANFCEHRLERFGDYEDAILANESWLWHAVLTPMLNIGLLTPRQVLDEVLAFASKNELPLNSVEGFVRQMIGWREFMRATYEDLGVQMRTSNHWGHKRPMPASFYEGTTGLDPLDDVIQRALETGYCHHIERLMVLGGFMFLCEFEPREIYRWFMEMFVDSYDWVMVPNVYAMSQHADGGLITTKPYFSGSSYIRKMSNYKQGDWCEVWDGLYWRWIWNHVEELGKNPRWAMMCSMAKKMDQAKRERHLEVAEEYLQSLDGSMD